MTSLPKSTAPPVASCRSLGCSVPPFLQYIYRLRLPPQAPAIAAHKTADPSRESAINQDSRVRYLRRGERNRKAASIRRVEALLEETSLAPLLNCESFERYARC